MLQFLFKSNFLPLLDPALLRLLDQRLRFNYVIFLMVFLATMMWSIGMADRDTSGEPRARPLSSTRVSSEDEEELLESVDGEGPTNEAAENAIRALGAHDEEQNPPNESPDGDEEESESRKLSCSTVECS